MPRSTTAGKKPPLATRPSVASAVLLRRGESVETAVRELSSRDRTLARFIERIGPCGLDPTPGASVFDALMRSIVYQQLSGKAAASILRKVQSLFSETEALRNPTPEEIIDADPEFLRSGGLSRSKILSLKDLAARVVGGELPTLEALFELEDEVIVERLTTVRGIGRWSVEMLLIFRLGRPDVWPVQDYGIRKGYQRLFRTEALPKPEEMVRRAERWRPYRTIASWYLWRAAELTPPEKRAEAGGTRRSSAGTAGARASKRAARPSKRRASR